jgi:hypothetical protein
MANWQNQRRNRRRRLEAATRYANGNVAPVRRSRGELLSATSSEQNLKLGASLGIVVVLIALAAIAATVAP